MTARSSWPLRLLFCATLVFLAAVTGAQTPDPFAPKNERPEAAGIDPFALEFRAEEEKNPAQPPEVKKEPAPKLSLTAQELVKLLDLQVEVTPARAKPGEVVRVVVKGTPRESGYTYPITKRTSFQSAGTRPKLSYAPNDLFQPLYPLEESAPQDYELKIGKATELHLVHAKPFTWTQEVLIDPQAKPGKTTLSVEPRLMVCSKKTGSCYGPDRYPSLEVPFEVLPGKVDVAQAVLDRTKPAPQEVVQVAGGPPVGGKEGGTRPGTVPPGATDPRDLGGLLGFAFVGALLMLLTPCVFPMIPITVNFFLKQSEKEHHQPVRMATVYCGTIILTLTIAMMALGTFVVTLANNPWFNLGLGLVLVFFALSLFGMYEIELPHFLARFTSAREGQGGLAGTIFMALTFTITSFTCTGPFIGLLFAPLAELKPPATYILLACLVYSATFAAPFFFLALFPGLLRKLPKSGGWLNAVKVTMGFVELGAALKFLANMDYALHPGRPILFTHDAVLCAWIALSFACGLYLMGLFRLPHDDAQEHIGVVRMIFATIFLGFSIYLTPALFGGRPTGAVGDGVRAFLPPKLQQNQFALGGGGHGGRGEHLAWHLDYIDAWKEATKENKLILMDFTGVNCTNCRDNEENVFSRPEVQKEMRKYALVQLYTDTVPNPQLDASEASDQADRNKTWRDTLLKDATLPNYAVFQPDPKEPFDANGLPQGRILGTRKDLIRDVGDFVQFLKGPLEQRVARAR